MDYETKMAESNRIILFVWKKNFSKILISDLNAKAVLPEDETDDWYRIWA